MSIVWLQQEHSSTVQSMKLIRSEFAFSSYNNTGLTYKYNTLKFLEILTQKLRPGFVNWEYKRMHPCLRCINKGKGVYFLIPYATILNFIIHWPYLQNSKRTYSKMFLFERKFLQKHANTERYFKSSIPYMQRLLNENEKELQQVIGS